MKKKAFVLILVLMVAFLGGCWSRREVEDLAIVSATGIDRITVGGQKKYRVTFLIVRPRQLGGGRQASPAIQFNPDWLISEVGDSLYDAVRNVSRRSPRAVVLYHNDAVIIGQETAREGISDIVDFMQRHKDIRLRTLVFISKQSAEGIMKALPKLEQTVSQEITEMTIKSNPMVSMSYPVDLRLFTEALIIPGWDPVAPVIKTVFAKEPLGSQRAQKEALHTIALDGMAVFKKDKLAGFLSPVETRSFLLMMGKANSGILPVRLPEQGGATVSLMMARSSSDFKPVIREGRLVMEVTIKTEADVVEVDGNVPVGDPQVLKLLSSKYSETVKSLAQGALDRAQKQYKADIFGMGNKVHKKYPDYWHEIEKEWYDIYPELPVVIKVEGKVKRTSMIADPLRAK